MTEDELTLLAATRVIEVIRDTYAEHAPRADALEGLASAVLALGMLAGRSTPISSLRKLADQGGFSTIFIVGVELGRGFKDNWGLSASKSVTPTWECHRCGQGGLPFSKSECPKCSLNLS